MIDAPAATVRLLRLALVAAWGALAAGLLEALLRGVQKFVLHRTVYYGAHLVWMAPVAEVVVFTAAALVLAVPVGLAPRWGATRVVVSAMAFVGGLGIVLQQPYLHWWADVALAAGVAAALGRFAAAREELALRVMRRSLPLLIGIVVAGAASVHLHALLREGRARAALPASAPGAPNVLLIIWDTVRAANLGLYGYARPTAPTLSALAARGVVFDRAFATASYTLPSHASLFTGRWPHELRTSWSVPLDAEVPTLAEALARRGYVTAGFSANWIYVTREHGLDRGFVHFEDFVASPGEMLRSSTLIKSLMQVGGVRRLIGYYEHPGRRGAMEITRAFQRWRAAVRGRPWFAFLNVFDPHEPYLPPPPFDTMFGWSPGTPRAAARRFAAEAITPKRELGPEAARRQLDLYDGAIAAADHALGVLLDSLRSTGDLEHTLVIVASDHGEEFGEHRVFSHGNTVYPLSLHVPLVVVFPGRVPAGVRVPQTVSLRDVPATVGDLLGADAGTWRFSGVSLARLWRGDSAAAGHALAEIDRLPIAEVPWYPVAGADLRSLISGRYQVVLTGDSVELFDLAADPEGRRDLARDSDGRARAAALADTLRQLRANAVPDKR